MMKYLPLVFAFWFPALLAGQQLFPLRSATDSIRFSVTSEEGKLALRLNQALPKGSGGLPAITGLRIEDGGLIASYEYPGRLKKGLAYEMNIALLPEGGPPMLPAPGQVIDQREKDNTGALNWPDRTERGLDYGGAYTLVVLKSLLGEVDCSGSRPAFGLDQQWPYFTTALAGGGLLVLGQIYNQDRKEAYERYQDAWAIGADTESAESDFQEAKDKDATARLLTYIGGGLLAIDALGFAWRWGVTKRRQGLYDQYCAKEGLSSLTVKPCILTPGAPEGIMAGAGLRLRFQF